MITAWSSVLYVFQSWNKQIVVRFSASAQQPSAVLDEMPLWIWKYGVLLWFGFFFSVLKGIRIYVVLGSVATLAAVTSERCLG